LEIACDYCGEQGNSAAWDEFRVEVEQKIRDVRGHGRSIPVVFLSRPHAEYLAEPATIRNADLIIMGHSHGLLKWSTLHSGTLPQLLAEAPCPVLTIPEKTA
jgi:nucleotide-binding universal stress UspA family protein